MTRTPQAIALFRTLTPGRPSVDRIHFDEEQARAALVVGLGPLLHRAADEAEGLLPAPYALPVACADLAAKRASDLQTTALHDMLDAADGLSGHITLLKGIDARDQYPARHLRTMGDIDLLVDAPYIPTLEEGLEDLGYQREALRMPEEFYEDHHHSRPFVHADTGVRVEIHRELASPKTRLAMVPAFQTESVLSHRILSELDGRPVCRLSPELNFVYTVSHWCYDLRLPFVSNGLVDSMLLLRQEKHELDWKVISSWLNDQRVATALYIMLTYLEKHELAECDPGFRPALYNAKKSVGPLGARILHSIVNASLAGRLYLRKGSLDAATAAWRSMTWSRRPAWNALRLPLSLLFPHSDGYFSIRHSGQRAVSQSRTMPGR